MQSCFEASVTKDSTKWGQGENDRGTFILIYERGRKGTEWVPTDLQQGTFGIYTLAVDPGANG